MVGATRKSGPSARPWEYWLLDAIAKDSPPLIRLVQEQHGAEVDWEVRIADFYGRHRAGEVHYLVASFGLNWRVGMTLLDTARLNDKEQAVAAMESAQRHGPIDLPRGPAPADGAPENGVRVALVQSASDLGAVAANLARLEGHVRRAAAQGARVVVLPEAAVTGYLSQDLRRNWGLRGRPQSYPLSLDPSDYAEARDGASVRQMAALARELGLYITVPFLEREGEDFFNAVTLVGPESPVEEPGLAHYRKNCPWPHPEKSWASPGAGVDGAVYETPFGRVGLAVCFDIHSILAKYADQELWALLYPIAWVGSTMQWFARELPERLARVRCPHYILGANWATVAPQAWQGAGGSSAYGPGGNLLAQAQENRFRGCEELVLLSIPRQEDMPRVGPLDKEAYARWTQEQPGTDYWAGPPK